MSHKFDPQRADKLIAPERYQELKPDVLLQKLGVAPGGTILDLGCANGFFTLPAAAAMGENGMVIAADVSEQMLTLLNRRMPPDNVQVLQVEEVAMEIENDSVDGAVIISLYHEFKTPGDNLKELKRVLKPGGKALFLDWDPLSDRERGPRQSHRVSQSDAVNALEAEGFTIEIRENYVNDIWLILAQLLD